VVKHFLKATQSHDPFVFYGRGFEATLGPVLASQLTSPKRKKQRFRKAFHRVAQHHIAFTERIFSWSCLMLGAETLLSELRKRISLGS